MTPGDYHQRLRVTRVRELLELTDDMMKQLAAAVGYEDPCGLQQAFQRLVGLSRTENRGRFRPISS